jgi:hypothetical protein
MESFNLHDCFDKIEFLLIFDLNASQRQLAIEKTKYLISVDVIRRKTLKINSLRASG